MDTLAVKNVIDQWAISVAPNDHYRAPEIRGNPVIIGVVKGGNKDGKQIQTSRIAKFDGRYVTTKSGSVYFLAEPGQLARDWYAHIGVELNPENPLAGLGNYIRVTE